MIIPMSSPDITQAEMDAVQEVLKSGWLSNGPKIKDFETLFARYIGTTYATGVSSGTTGLHLSIIAAGFQPGDEIITSSFSFVASANSALYENAIPVFVDIDYKTGNLNPDLIEEKITERTRAIMPIHVFGQPADMAAICRIASKYDLMVIEDAAEAVGAEYNGRRAGTFGDCAVFGFYPNKQMTTCEGGMIVTNHEGWQRLFQSLRNQGRDDFTVWLEHNRLGYNYRLDEMSAALGVVQLQRLEELLQKREQVANWYNACIDGIDGVDKPYIAPTTSRMSWFVYVIQLNKHLHRKQIVEGLQQQNIASRPYFSPIHLQEFYKERFGYQSGMFPMTEQAGRSFLALPFSSVMTKEQVEIVADALAQTIAMYS
jgi:dTDP-4-amino-4,6-dideoxygalactose transaminase